MNYDHHHAKIHQKVAANYFRLKTEGTDLSWILFYQKFAAYHYKEARRLMGLEGAE